MVTEAMVTGKVTREPEFDADETLYWWLRSGYTAPKKRKPAMQTLAGFLVCLGVADGARTHDNRNHNPGLYQLSYSHRMQRQIIACS